jgi:hypothetical protein
MAPAVSAITDGCTQCVANEVLAISRCSSSPEINYTAGAVEVFSACVACVYFFSFRLGFGFRSKRNHPKNDGRARSLTRVWTWQKIHKQYYRLMPWNSTTETCSSCQLVVSAETFFIATSRMVMLPVALVAAATPS